MAEKADITPVVLKWARESARISLEDAGAKAAVTAKRIEQWESGTDRPTILQAELLAKAYKRPFAVFFLPSPPRDFQILQSTTMEDYALVYRCAIVVKPLQPFLDWLVKIESENYQPLSELQQDSNVYLLPDFEEAVDVEKAIDKYVTDNYAGIFTSELSKWYLDPACYPKISYSTFLEWFNITTHTMVYDTVESSIEKE